nr:1-acyl-sn-glycerol-3-phosphate acyltransferase [Chthoniobacterales bacterium]
MNHQSYLDPPLAGISSGREVYFLARKTLLDGPVLGRLLRKLNVVPVDQEGTDRRALKALLRILKAGNGTVVFPEGARTRDGKLQPALPGLGFVIAKTKAPVLPMRIFGAREALPRGSSRLRLCRITVVIGKPLHFTEADLQPAGKELYQRLSERVMDAIAALQLD